MKIFKTLLISAVFIFMVAAPVMTVATPQTAAAAGSCEGGLLGIPPWYRGLTNNDPPKCTMKTPDQVGGLSAYVWRIVLNGIDIALALLSIVTVFFILYGGFLYMTGGAVPSQLEKARKTIFNAIIGLVICMGAIAITNLVFSIIQ